MTAEAKAVAADGLRPEWDGLPLLVGGSLVQGRGALLEVQDPATEQIVARIAAADAGQVDQAVAAARAAFDHGSWPRMSGAERKVAIHRFADVYESYVEQFADAIISEVGTPVAIAEPLQVRWALDHLRWYAEQATVDRTEDLGPHKFPTSSHSEVAYRPVGVVAAISAYNFPLTLLMHKVGPALATGCTAVVMPSPRTPIATLLLARAITESGLPDGVLNVIAGDVDVARRLTECPGVDKVAFTGSPAVGIAVMQQAAKNLAGVVLELGGKSPAILMPDVDLKAATKTVHLRYCRNAGQACAAPTRLLVPRARWDDFLEASTETYADVAVGDPRDPVTVVGPLITERHREGIETRVGAAIERGATIAAGGGRPDLPRGWYLNPVLLTNVDNSWPIAQEELFGPVAVAIPYDTLDDAVAIANDSRFGLHAYVYSADTDAARALAARLRVGTVTINGGGGMRPDAPMGGFGISGVGREIGKWGLHEYLEPQHIQWAT
jgi:aldehyde dehydrogenase (NAD+)